MATEGVISGCLYNKENMPNKENDKNKFHSEKSKNGWNIYRHLDTGAEVHWEEDGTYVLYTPTSITIQSDGNILIKSESKIQIQSPEIELESDSVKSGKISSSSKLVKEGHIDTYNALKNGCTVMFNGLTFLDALFGGAYTALKTAGWDTYTAGMSETGTNVTTETKAS
jgi:hypothetical protein